MVEDAKCVPGAFGYRMDAAGEKGSPAMAKKIKPEAERLFGAEEGETITTLHIPEEMVVDPLDKTNRKHGRRLVTLDQFLVFFSGLFVILGFLFFLRGIPYNQRMFQVLLGRQVVAVEDLRWIYLGNCAFGVNLALCAGCIVRALLARKKFGVDGWFYLVSGLISAVAAAVMLVRMF